MAGPRHQALVRIFEDRPELVRLLLGDRLSLPGPARVVSTDLTQLRAAERYADVVITFGTPPHRALIVEPQLQPVVKKRFVWPQYLTSAHERYECPVELLIITLERAVASWCKQPITVSSNWVLRPTVIGPDELNALSLTLGPEQPPELAWLTALAHTSAPNAHERAAHAIKRLSHLDNVHVDVYADILIAALPAAARRMMEELMGLETYKYQSDFARKHFSKGLEQGLERGLSKGQHLCKVHDILLILDTKGFCVDTATKARLLATDDTALLDTWLRRAITATSLAQVFSG